MYMSWFLEGVRMYEGCMQREAESMYKSGIFSGLKVVPRIDTFW